ncbi:MAG: class E sortase [Ilumatobacteraceae bacterium]
MAETEATGLETGANAPVASTSVGGERGGGKVRKFDRPKSPRDWRFFVGGLGKVLIAVGLLMFGFVAYQHWGTGIETARAQNSLESEFDELLAGTTPDSPATEETAPVDSVPVDSTPVEVAPVDSAPAETAVPVTEQELPVIAEGDPLARLEIPRIDVDWIVVAGVEKSDLKKGPGHYPETPLPGQLGNAAIAGHRTTYGQPFYSIEQLQPGDEIITTTPSGRFVYTVTGTQIVSPDDYLVVTTTDPTIATLTLTSCHPRWTTNQRIVVTSQLDQAQSDPVGEAVINYGRPLDPIGAPAVVAPTDTAAPDVSTPTTIDPATVTSEPVTTEPSNDPAGADPDASIDASIADAFSEGWFSDPTANAQVGLWGVILALIGLGAYLISRTAKRDWVGALVGIIPFAIALYFFFQNVNRLLPPNL